MKSCSVLRAVCLCLLGWCAIVSAAEQGSSSVQTPNGRISGLVVDDADRPISGVTVSLVARPGRAIAAVTGPDGRFAFTALPAGRYSLSATRIGRPRVAYGTRSPLSAGSDIVLTPSQSMRDIRLVMASGAVLAGRVLDDHGNPKPDVPVSLFVVRTTLTGTRAFDLSPDAPEMITTDDLGRFRFAGLPSGSYAIGTSWSYTPVGGYRLVLRPGASAPLSFQAIGEPNSTPSRADPLVNFGASFFPGVANIEAAELITTKAGAVIDGLDFKLPLNHVATIRGHVFGESGPQPNSRLALFQRSPIIPQRRTITWVARADGGFESPALQEGDYFLVATSPATASPAWDTAEIHIGNGGRAEVDLHLRPGARIDGHVRFLTAAGQASPPPLTSIRFSLAPINDLPLADRVKVLQPDENGSFDISAIPSEI